MCKHNMNKKCSCRRRCRWAHGWLFAGTTNNNDLCEESLRGKGTTHGTNDIAIQRRSYGPQLEPETLGVSKLRHRSLLWAFLNAFLTMLGHAVRHWANTCQPWFVSSHCFFHWKYASSKYVCIGMYVCQDFAWLFEQCVCNPDSFFYLRNECKDESFWVAKNLFNCTKCIQTTANNWILPWRKQFQFYIVTPNS